MKRIIFIIESLHLGGSEKSLTSLLAKLDLSKYSFEILLYKKGGEFEKFIPDSVKVSTITFRPSWKERIVFKLRKLLNLNKKYHNAQLFWKTIKTSVPIHNGNYDIAIAWGQGFATYYTSSKLKSLKKIAWINTDIMKAGYYIPFDRKFYKRFDKLIGVSEYVKNELETIYPENEVELIRDIIDEDEILSWSKKNIELEFQKDVLNIVSVGRLAKAKSFELAIGAIQILKEKVENIHLYIIGEGPEREYLESIIAKFKLDYHITLLGYLENPFPYIKACDIYLQTSKFEGLGRTILEAGLLKKPIVTTNFPTASQILINRETGLIVDMHSKNIAEAIQELSLNIELRNKLISNLEKSASNETKKTINSVQNLLERA